MRKTIEWEPTGVCSKKMIITIQDDVIAKVQIIGGCPGNTIGLSKLCEGRKIEEVIQLLKGIPCGARKTSCPDQLAIALEKVTNKQEI